MKIEVIPTKKGFYNRIVASNGKTLFHSETYNTKRAAVDAATSVVKNAGEIQIKIVE